LLDDGEIEEELEDFMRAFEFYQLEELIDQDNNSDDEEDDDNGDEDEDDDDDDDDFQSLPLAELNKKQKRSRHQMAKDALDSYYRENWRGSSISSMLYSISLSMSKVTNDVLWSGIVGTTSQYLQNEIDFERFNVEIGAFNAEWSRLNNAALEDANFRRDNPLDEMDDNGDPVDNDDNSGGVSGENGMAADPDGDDPSNRQARYDQNKILLSRQNLEKFTDGRIFRDREFRFMLLRHWNLYDSIMYSPFSATKLRIWSERGKQRLDTLLSKMGQVD
jgi:cell division control protein 45